MAPAVREGLSAFSMCVRQEIQHVIAREQGYSRWRVDDGVPRFESITELSDADIRVLLREVGGRDLALALQGLVDGRLGTALGGQQAAGSGRWMTGTGETSTGSWPIAHGKGARGEEVTIR